MLRRQHGAGWRHYVSYWDLGLTLARLFTSIATCGAMAGFTKRDWLL
jgi:hypothetical protein